MKIEGWNITSSDDGRYLYITLDGSPGMLHVKAEDEGFVADFWTDDTTPVCVASTAASYCELEPE